MELPHHLHIEPTTLCDLNCLSCINGSLPKSRRGSLSLANLKKIIEPNPFIKDVSLVGLGESLLNKDIVSMAAWLNDRGIKCRTATNGMALDGIEIRQFLSYLDELVISFDSADKQLFESSRPGADFEKIKENVRIAVLAKKNAGLVLDISLQSVISKNNVAYLGELFPLAELLGVDKLRFSAATQYLLSEGRSPDTKEKQEWSRIESLKVESAEAEFEDELRDRLNLLAEEHAIPYSLAGFKPRYKDCWWPGGGVFVTWDGYVTPCCMRMDPLAFNFGNLFDKPLLEILSDLPYQQFISEHKKGACPDVCRECP